MKLDYHRLGKPDKELVKRNLAKVTGLSRAVVLEGRSKQDAWLTGTKEKALAVAEPLADGLLDAHPISARINNPNARGRELLDPISAV